MLPELVLQALPSLAPRVIEANPAAARRTCFLPLARTEGDCEDEHSTNGCTSTGADRFRRPLLPESWKVRAWPAAESPWESMILKQGDEQREEGG